MDNNAERQKHYNMLRNERKKRQRSLVSNSEWHPPNATKKQLIPNSNLQSHQMPLSNYPLHYHNPLQLNEVSQLPFRRRFSIASYPHIQYQPINPLYYHPGNNNSGSRSCFMPYMNPNIDAHIQPLNVQNNDNGTEENTDDDVFSNNSNASENMAVNNYPDTEAKTILSQLQSRKRAHSAGDMSMIRAKQLYQRNANLVQNKKTIGNQVEFANQLNSKSNGHLEPPSKRKYTDFESISAMHSNHQTQPRHFHLKSHSFPLHCHNSTLLNPTEGASKSDEVHTKSYIKSNEKLHAKTDGGGCSTEITIGDYKNVAESSLIDKEISLNTPRKTTDSTILPSNSSSMKVINKFPVKKKVLWNDQVEKQKISDSTNINHNEDTLFNDWTSDQISKENIKNLESQVKSKPSEYTAKLRIGPYLIGPSVGNSAAKNISQFIVRKENTNNYFIAKVKTVKPIFLVLLRVVIFDNTMEMVDIAILILNSNGPHKEVQSGKVLLYTEYSLLRLLSSHKGIIHQHGMFKDYAYDPQKGSLGCRHGLILDCLIRNEYSSNYNNYTNLQQYVIQTKRLSEKVAIGIFHSIISIVYSLHKINVVHRDLKLGNMILNVKTRQITLTNFGLGCHLNNENDLLNDQRGSPAYISPDVLNDKPYAGKPSDMWSLGVIFFTMLYGQFPFYDPSPKKLFTKIKSADYTIPSNSQISEQTNKIIRGLLTLNPSRRMTAQQTLSHLELLWGAKTNVTLSNKFQVVPDINDFKKDSKQSCEEQQVKDQNLTLAFRQKLASEENGIEDFYSAGTGNNSVEKNSSIVEVTHLNHDAYSLNNEEMLRHQFLLSCSRNLSNRNSL